MPITKCEQCRSDVYKRPSHMRLYTKHFCNAACQKEYEKAHNQRIEVKCEQCGSSLTRNRRQLRQSKSGRYFCNNLCKNRFLIAFRWKDNGPAKDHQHMREKIIEKCGGVCVNCGYDKDSRMMDIHHVDGNHQNNVLENLWSACIWCHQSYHRCGTPIEKKYGV